MAHVEDLDGYWSSHDEPLSPFQLDDLFELFRKHPPPDNYVVIPSGFPFSANLPSWPLRNRTRNGLLRVGKVANGGPISVGEFLQIPNLGIKSLVEFMCVAEAVLGSAEPTTISAAQRPVLAPSPVLRALRPLLSAAAEFHGARTLSDVFELDMSRFIAELGIVNGLAGVRFMDDIDDEWFTDGLVEEIANFLNEINAADREILDLRLYRAKPMPYRQLGSLLGVTGEAVRRRVARLEARLLSITQDKLPGVVNILRSRLGPIATTKEFETLINETFRPPAIATFEASPKQDDDSSRSEIGDLEDPAAFLANLAGSYNAAADVAWEPSQPDDVGHVSETDASGYGLVSQEDAGHPAIDLLRRILVFELDYSCAADFCLDSQAHEIIEELRKAPADDAGLVDEASLFDSLPDSTWEPHWEVLIEKTGFVRIGTHLAKKDSATARSKAALIDFGRPATKEEIAEAAGLSWDTASRLGARLSALRSVGRAGKETWALLDDIDDVYEGIPAEIIQRIEEDGGATTLQRLIEELPRQFGVSEGSVRTYALTPQFTIRDGSVSIADESTLKFRNFDDVIDGKTDEGHPYWQFTVEERYFNGYSLPGFPPEIARHLGCEPNASLRIKVSEPAGCRPISVIWRLASMTGATVGYLADPLEALGVGEGAEIRLVLKPDNTVRFSVVAEAVESTSIDNNAGDLLERLKRRRQVL